MKNNSTIYTYNEWKRIKEITRPDGKKIVINDSQAVSMINNYIGGVTGTSSEQGKNSGQLADGIKDAKGINTSFIQDESGYVSTIIDGAGKTTLVARDLKGRPTIVTRPDTTTVAFTYDQKTGDLLSKTDSATGTSESYVYDTYGNLLSKTDALGRRIINTYDNKGQLVKTTNEILGTSMIYTYNSYGLLVSQTNSMGQTSSVIYDVRGNVSQSISPEGKQTNFIYHPSGLLQKVTDANNTSSLYEYDSMNRLLAVTTGGTQKTQYNYQETGELIQIVDPNSKITNFYYDNLGQLIKKVGTRGETTELAYDENGNTIQEKTPSGQFKYFYYDNLNQLVRKLLPDDEYNFNYDVRGNVTSVRNLHSQIDLAYQHFDGGDVISQAHSYGIGSRTDLPNTNISYNYNDAGEKIGMITPKGTFQYGRDAAGRLRRITNHKGEVFTMDYDYNQRLNKITTPATLTAFSFDNSGFNTQISHTRKSGALIEKFIYGKDEVGNRVSKTSSSGTSTYSYDKNYQLIQSITPNLSVENFTYDSIGNRLSDGNSTYIYDQTNQLIQEDWKYFYTFDQNGNMTSKQEKGMTGNLENYDYTSENQMRAFKLYKNGILTKEVTYTFDALGRRIEKVILDHEVAGNSYTKHFAYDGSEILFELDDQNTITLTYTHSTLRTDDPLAVANSQGTFYFVKDGLGSITDVTDADGFKIQHHDYTSFGVLASVTDPNGNDISATPRLDPYFTYTGREYDKESGLYHYRARAYSAELGRFLQVDPDVGSLKHPITHINKYSYVANNPINYVDPKGLKISFRTIVAAVIVGCVFGPVGAGAYVSWHENASDKSANRADNFTITAAIITTAFYLSPGAAAVALGGTFVSRRKKGNPFDDLRFAGEFSVIFGLSYAGEKSGFAKVTPTTFAGVYQDMALGVGLTLLKEEIYGPQIGDGGKGMLGSILVMIHVATKE